MTRWLVVGGSGHLGRALVAQLHRSGDAEVEATYLTSAPSDTYTGDGSTTRWHRADLRSPRDTAALVADRAPDIVVNAAYVQSGPDLRAVTEVAPGDLSRACARAAGRFVQVSTDQVFAGDARRPYREDDPAVPIVDYGRAKLAAEVACAGRDLVIRTSLLYGGAVGGAQERLVSAATTDRSLRFYTDEVRSPIRVDDLAVAIVELAPTASGLLHIAGPDAVDRLTFARRLAPGLGVDPDMLLGAPADPSLGARPKRCALDSTRARRLLTVAPRGLP